MRKPAKTFEDLLVWQKAHLYVLAFIVYLWRLRSMSYTGILNSDS
ncbi:MAG: hypothetical protein AB1815_02310 [Bacillota bacterium]